MTKQFLRGAAIALTLTLTGCATSGDPRDPIEPINRGIYQFNDVVDKAVTKPIAQGYRAILPTPVRQGVTNFFANIDDVLITVNDLLQFKINQAASDFGRLIFNTTFGIAGLFDVATPIGLEKHNEDFGQTLGYWGIGDGPFLMLPILGPSDVRDTVGLVATFYTDPILNLDHVPTRNTLNGLRFVDRRARLLDSEKVLDEAALDRYSFLRDSYLQHRRNLVYDGNPPREKLDEDGAAAPVKKSEADESPASQAAVAAVPTTEQKPEAVAMAAAAEQKPEVEKPAQDEGGGLPALVTWLLSGHTAGWQE